MSKLIVNNKKWVKKTNGLFKDRKIQKIFEFFVLGCPYPNASAMSIDLSKYFKNNSCSSKTIERYIFESIGLIENKTYIVSDKLEMMKEKAQEIGLNTDFKCRRNKEKIIIYKNENGSIQCLLYYIRCSLAHGSFRIISINNKNAIALESTTYSKKDNGYIVKGRAILKYSSLLKLKSLIINGDKGYKDYCKNRDLKILDTIKELLYNNEIKSQKEIKEKLKIGFVFIKKLCDKYKKKIDKSTGKYLINN